MDEILQILPEDAQVLDLGSGGGSFEPVRSPTPRIVRVDLSLPAGMTPPGFVQSDAASLPFVDGVFDAVIANHSLEHIDRFEIALLEIGRVLKPNGHVFIAVPDARTLSDRIYRWVYHGGGHINAITSADEFARSVSAATGLPLAAVRELRTSFGFLNHRNFQPRPPRRLMVFGNGDVTFLAWMNYLARLIDATLGTRVSVYGWAFYFGAFPLTIDRAARTNVCVGCGCSRPSRWLVAAGIVRNRRLVVPAFRCPDCGAWNLFTDDRP